NRKAGRRQAIMGIGAQPHNRSGTKGTGWQGKQPIGRITGAETMAGCIVFKTNTELTAFLPLQKIPSWQGLATAFGKYREKRVRFLNPQYGKGIGIMALNRRMVICHSRQVYAGIAQDDRRLIRPFLLFGAHIRSVIADTDNAVGITPGEIGLPLARPDKAFLR